MPGRNRSSRISRVSPAATTPMSRWPSPTTSPTTAVAKTVAAVVTPRTSPSRPLRISPPPMNPTPVTMPANACGLAWPVTAAAASAAAVTGQASPQALAGIVTGVGFIGGGLILKGRDGDVRGVTTAATVFATAVVGLVVGLGHLLMGVVAAGLTLLILELRFLPGIRLLDAHRYQSRVRPDAVSRGPGRPVAPGSGSGGRQAVGCRAGQTLILQPAQPGHLIVIVPTRHRVSDERRRSNRGQHASRRPGSCQLGSAARLPAWAITNRQCGAAGWPLAEVGQGVDAAQRCGKGLEDAGRPRQSAGACDVEDSLDRVMAATARPKPIGPRLES